MKTNMTSRLVVTVGGIVLAGLMFLQTAIADTLELNPNHPDRYTVKKGDTLWDISAMFLKDPWYWPEIWHVNPQVENPHLIYPGDVLALRWIDGKPVLMLEKRGGIVKLSPTTREEELLRAIDTIPLDIIYPYLSENRVVEAGELEAAPYIVSSAGDHLIASHGNQVYVMGIDEPSASYGIYRKGDPYTSPYKPDQFLGYEAIHLGNANMQVAGSPATLTITKANQEILNGSRLLPFDDEAFNSQFYPKPFEGKSKGSIISVLKGVANIGRYDAVVLDLGMEDGINTGDVLVVSRAGAAIKDPITGDTVILPEEVLGTLLVFRPFEKVSYGLIMRAQDAIHVGDSLSAPTENQKIHITAK